MYWLFCYKIILNTFVFVIVYLGDLDSKLTLVYFRACLDTLG